MVRCGCGAQVADGEGPRHPYMAAEPGCWSGFGELQVRLLSGGVEAPSVVDAYAAQHPGNAERERRQRQSVAVHLIVLCLSVEHGVRGSDLTRFRSNVSARVLPRLGVGEWPVLTPPAQWGDLNAVTVSASPDDRLGSAAREWSSQVWHAWSHQHDVVADWAALVLAGGRR